MDTLIYLFAIIGIIASLYFFVCLIWGIMLENSMTEDEKKEFYAEQDED